MADLSAIVTTMGVKNVTTFIQSGNVIFDSTETDIFKLNQKIEKHLHKQLGYEVVVLLRTLQELIDITETNPFGNNTTDEAIKCYVTFLKNNPDKTFTFPIISEKDGLEIFQINNLDVFILSREVKGRYGFPNNFLEKEMKVSATTRNWTTICKMIELGLR